jgi:hypothetical protein
MLILKKFLKFLTACLPLVFILPLGASALTCPEGQIVGSMVVSAAVPEVPAVTHTEIVVDSPAWDETVIDAPAYDEYVNVGQWHGDYAKIGSDYIFVGHNLGRYDKVHHDAVTHVVHHEAVTHEVVIVDTEAIPAVDPVYEDQCVSDPNYVAPTPKKEETKSSQVGGGRHPVMTTSGWYCPQPLRADNDPMGYCAGKYVNSEKELSLSDRLESIKARLLQILSQLQSM